MHGLQLLAELKPCSFRDKEQQNGEYEYDVLYDL